MDIQQTRAKRKQEPCARGGGIHVARRLDVQAQRTTGGAVVKEAAWSWFERRRRDALSKATARRRGVAEATMTTAADASGKGYAGIENYLHDLQYRKSKKTVLHSVTSECERDERDAAARVRRGSRSDPTSRD